MSMQVQEFTDLARWFKANVLELSGDDADVDFDEPDFLDVESDEPADVETVNAHTDDDQDNDTIIFSEISAEQARLRNQQDELSLFEFIVGIDGMS